MSDEPVFAEAWQAQAFAMVQALQQQGRLTPREGHAPRAAHRAERLMGSAETS